MRESPRTRSAASECVSAAGLAIAIFAMAGCARRVALPEAGSPAAQLYKSRCGNCHAAYNPRAMTAAMWQIQVDAMQDKMRRAGIPPLDGDDRKLILDYLTRNAGNQ